MNIIKKYIIITPYFPSDSSHVGSYIYDQAKTINSVSEFSVKVIKVVSFFSCEVDYTFKGIEVKVFRLIDFPFFIFPGVFNWLNSIRIRRFLKNKNLFNDLEVVHSHVCYPSSYLANSIASMLNVKTIVQHHGLDVLQLLNGRFNVIARLQSNLIRKRSLEQLNNIGLNVSVSSKVQSNLHSFKGYKPKREYILYNGVDRRKFYNMNVVKSSDKFQIGCIANFWKTKDHITLIKAVELLVFEGVKNLQLTLIGSGQELDFCKNYVVHANLTEYIFFEQERNHSDLNIFYNGLDLFVLPSYYEALGCVLLEAWATDLPIISVRGQGISDLIPNDEIKNLLVDARSPKSLKVKIFDEYKKRRRYLFNPKYDINNTIREFLAQSFFDEK